MGVKRDNLVQAVAGTIRRHRLIGAGQHVLAAVSGGADSVALVSALVDLSGGLRGGFSLTLAHLDHGLRPTSADDAASVARLAGQYGLALISERLDVARAAEERGLGLEEAARVVRYDFLHRAARQAGAGRVALGHHQDDQAETVLMNFLRGGDVRGLAGMPICRPIEPESPIMIIRPLLEVRRQALRDFLHRRGLDWVEDETNLVAGSLRNRIRLELLPLLERDYVAGISRRLAGMANRMNDLSQEIQRRADERWPQVLLEGGDRQQVQLDRQQLLDAGRAVGSRLICRAMEMLLPGLGAITAEHLEAAWDIVESSRGGRRIALPGGLQLRREAECVVMELTVAKS